MESDIRDEQAVLIAEMQNALERLSRIHSSLTLLTKLENKNMNRRSRCVSATSCGSRWLPLMN